MGESELHVFCLLLQMLLELFEAHVGVHEFTELRMHNMLCFFIAVTIILDMYLFYFMQWILDFLVCNGLGIWLGIKTSQYLEMKAYHWMGLWKIPTLK